MKRVLTLLIFISLIVSSPILGKNAYQELIFKARDNVYPALVHIQPVIKDYNTGELKKQAVIGSGVIFHPDGYVVTNFHVAGHAERIICTLNDKEQVTAELVGGDPSTDLAVLKLILDDYNGTIHTAKLGNSDSLEVGQFVLAMGSPLSLSRSVSSGVISTLDRYFSSEYRLPSGEPTGRYNLWIQTDAAINPGNSGGPLVNLNGEVIGINSRATFLANNLGFAIPVNIVKDVANSILSTGKVTRSWIGVECQALQELENWFGIEKNSGVLVSSVIPESPADKVGLRAGDVILKLNSAPVSARFLEELPKFYNSIASFDPNSSLLLNVLRGESEYEFSITTGELGKLQGDNYECSEWGLTVKSITHQMYINEQLNDTVGVYITGVKRVGPAGTSLVRRGDVIKTVNKKTVTNLTDFIELYERLNAAGDEKVLLQLDRIGAMRWAVLKLDKDKDQEGVNNESDQ